MNINRIFCEQCTAYLQPDQVEQHEKQCGTKYRDFCLRIDIKDDDPMFNIHLRTRSAPNLGIPYRYVGGDRNSRIFCLFTKSDKPLEEDVKTITEFAARELTAEADRLQNEAQKITKED